MARALLVFNPVAARHDSNALRAVRRVLTSEGWELDVAGTTRPGDAAVLAREGADDGVDLIAVYGGDGTTMQAVGGVVGYGVPIALIPGGTGNVLAGNLRLPRDPTQAARVAVHGIRRRIDLGRVERTDGPRYFAVACGTGLDAQVMAATSEEAKRKWGMGAYVARTFEAIGAMQGVAYRIKVDGKSEDVKAVMVVIANCREYVPPLFALRDAIALDDGLFDVVAVRAETALEGLGVVWRFLVGQTEGTDHLWFARGKRVAVETEQPRPVQLDGEPIGDTPLHAEIVPAAIEVMVQRPD
jgi:diacylglycerol kinase (ATP)